MTAQQQMIPGAEASEEPPETGSTALMRVIEKAAIDPTFDASKLAVLLQVKKEWEADEARKNFETAFQQFKGNLPEICKTKKVKFPNRDGQFTEYRHAELDKITPIIAEALLAYGITHYWETSDANGKTTVTCVLEGYHHTRKAATLSGPPDTSGGKNNVQAIGSTTYYLQRYTLLAACGMAPTGVDNDGKTEGLPEGTITDYCVAMQDASSWDELKRIFGEAWGKAKTADDAEAQGRFNKVKEQRKRDLAEHKQ